MTALLSTNGKKAASSESSWLQASVQTFFLGINWDDHPLEVQELQQTPAPVGPVNLSLQMSVARFFSAVNWDGSAIAAEVPLPDLEPETSEQSFTLEDFSDLF